MVIVPDQRLAVVPFPLDAKLSNLQPNGNSTKVESTSQFLDRISYDNRFLGLIVPLVTPSGSYVNTDFFQRVTDGFFSVEFYGFMSGIDNIDFLPVDFGVLSLKSGAVQTIINQMIIDYMAAHPDFPTTITRTSINAKNGLTHSHALDIEDLHRPVTIASGSSAMGSIDANQVLTLTPVETHPRVTIASGSSTLASIDTNQVLTIIPPTVHPAVTIGTDTIGKATIGTDQILHISITNGVDGYTPVKGVDYFDGAPGTDGTPAYLYIGYASDTNGSHFSQTPSQNLPYIAVVDTNTILPVNTALIEYGALYNWYAATDARGIAPVGFHVPSESEITTLITNIGGYLVAGQKLKESGTEHWDTNNGTNDYLFNAIGSGVRPTAYQFLKSTGDIWTYTETDALITAYILFLRDANNESYIGTSQDKHYGLALRFIADSGTPTTATGNDGKVYPCVTIGTQTWTAANSNETKYRNGDWITGFDGGVYTPIDNATWAALTSEAMCYYDNDVNNAYKLSVDPSIFAGKYVKYIGDTGISGVNAYVYIAYASDSSGTGFTNTFNSALDYIAVKTTITAITTPIVTDFTGLWKNYKGPKGDVGSVWRDGSGGPSYSLGVDGDYYLNNDNGAVYFKASGIYSVATNIFGADGAAGSVWRNGSGVPSDSLGVDGDYYLNGINGDVYKRVTGVYSVVANIRGIQGIQGIQGNSSAPASVTNISTNSDNGTNHTHALSSSFLGLNDTIDDTYLTKVWNVPRVSDTADSLVLQETTELLTVVAKFTLLSDCPSSLTGLALKGLRVRADELAIEPYTITAIGSWIDDIAFEFADVVAGTAKDYTLDIKASFGYTIEAACLEVDNGTLTGVTIMINATNITSLSSLTVNTAVSETASTALKTVVAGNRVWLRVGTGYTGTPTLIRGKLKIIRT